MSVIQIVSVGPTEEKQGKTGKTYAQVEVFYKNEAGKAMSKKIMNFNRDVFPTVAKAQSGEFYDVTTEKKGDFLEWVRIAKAEGGKAAQAAAAPTRTWGGGKSDETDVRIARSVALKAAIDYLATCASGKADKSPQAVLQHAVQFEVYLTQGAGGILEKKLEEEVAAKTDFVDDDIPE